MSEFNKNDAINFNYYINRVKEYNPKGRYQTEEGAIELDVEVKNMLDEYQIKYDIIDGDENAVNFITSEVMSLLGNRENIK